MSKVLVVGDLHLPACHPGYLSFCRDLQRRYFCDEVVVIGDICDFNAVSFHTHSPEMPGPKDEAELTHRLMRPWVKAFPEAKVCIGNHDRRVIRLAESVQIPARFLRDYADVWETPGWKWDEEFIVDNVHYSHGEGCSGEHPAYQQMQKMLMSVVIGHVHTAGGVAWLANPTRRMFGMSVGCGIDEKALAFAYGKHFRRRSIISAGVVLDGVPFHHICPIGPGEKYHRSNFKRSLK